MCSFLYWRASQNTRPSTRQSTSIRSGDSRATSYASSMSRVGVNPKPDGFTMSGTPAMNDLMALSSASRARCSGVSACVCTQKTATGTPPAKRMHNRSIRGCRRIGCHAKWRCGRKHVNAPDDGRATSTIYAGRWNEAARLNFSPSSSPSVTASRPARCSRTRQFPWKRSPGCSSPTLSQVPSSFVSRAGRECFGRCARTVCVST